MKKRPPSSDGRRVEMGKHDVARNPPPARYRGLTTKPSASADGNRTVPFPSLALS